MNASPLVSIVLPSYNGARFLEDSIQSCLDQTYDNWELILVDDASTDNTPAIVALFSGKDRRIRSVRHINNRKLPAALNSGFAIARGELLTWTSDDNRFKPEALERMVEYLSTHQSVDIVYTDYAIINESGEECGVVKVQPPAFIINENIVGPSFLYRRHVQSALVGYDEQLFLVEDYDFWLRASQQFHLSPLHELLYEYRGHDQSLSVTYLEEVKKGRRKALRKNIARIQGISSRQRAAGWINLAAYARIERDDPDFWSCILNAFRSCTWITLLVCFKVMIFRREVTYERPVNLPLWLL